MPRRQRRQQVCEPPPQVCEAPPQRTSALGNAALCEAISRQSSGPSGTRGDAGSGYGAPGTLATGSNLLETVVEMPGIATDVANANFRRTHDMTPEGIKGSATRNLKTGRLARNEIQPKPKQGAGAKGLGRLNKVMSVVSGAQNVSCAADEDLAWEDRYQCGVGAAGDAMSLIPTPATQLGSAAIALQQYGAGDEIHQQSDDIAAQGDWVRDACEDVYGDSVACDIGGGLTVLGSSLIHGIGNYGKAGMKMVSEPIDGIRDFASEYGRPASIEQAVKAANSGCLTHSSGKALSYLHRMGLDRNGNMPGMGGSGFSDSFEPGGSPNQAFGRRNGMGIGPRFEPSPEELELIRQWISKDPPKSSGNGER